MTENKRYSFNWVRGHPNFWDNHCDLADCYLTCEDVVKLLNELNDENQQLKHDLEIYEENNTNEVLNQLTIELTSRLNDCIEEFKQ